MHHPTLRHCRPLKRTPVRLVCIGHTLTLSYCRPPLAFLSPTTIQLSTDGIITSAVPLNGCPWVWYGTSNCSAILVTHASPPLPPLNRGLLPEDDDHEYLVNPDGITHPRPFFNVVGCRHGLHHTYTDKTATRLRRNVVQTSHVYILFVNVSTKKIHRIIYNALFLLSLLPVQFYNINSIALYNHVGSHYDDTSDISLYRFTKSRPVALQLLFRLHSE